MIASVDLVGGATGAGVYRNSRYLKAKKKLSDLPLVGTQSNALSYCCLAMGQHKDSPRLEEPRACGSELADLGLLTSYKGRAR